MEKNGKRTSRQKRNTILLVAAILLVAGIGWLVQRQRAAAHPGVYAVVQYQGKVYERLDLSEDRELLIDDGAGNYNRIQVKDRQLSVTEGNCADQICVYSYPIDERGGVIACLPHSLVIYVEGGED